MTVGLIIGQDYNRISIHTVLADGDVNTCSPLCRSAGFQSTPSLRTVTTAVAKKNIEGVISIHTVLADGDFTAHTVFGNVVAISIHTVLADGDWRRYKQCCTSRCISIHTVLADGDLKQLFLRPDADISIHTVLADGDNPDTLDILYPSKFQSTPSLRTVTVRDDQIKLIRGISIHTVLADGDYRRRVPTGRGNYFNPHRPCGR